LSYPVIRFSVMSMMSVFSRFRHLLIEIPADENAHPLDTEEAIIERKSLASAAQTG
jgi:hypothetical protein